MMSRNKFLLPLEEILGKEVRVYRNLHRACWSIQSKGRVIGYAHSVELAEPWFLVLPGGYARTRRENKKNVHAFVCGRVTKINHPPLTLSGKEVVYNPRNHPLFYTLEKCFKGKEFLIENRRRFEKAVCMDGTVWVSGNLHA